MNIRCPSCQTNYDVSGRPPGTMVTCHCGETFSFPRPVSMAFSLQCPGCGASADPGDQRCQYCDKPLASVCCPQCYTPMFAGNDHCGQCGTRVQAPALAVHRTGDTVLPCPRCSIGLTASLVGNHLFDRCDRCGGIWAHHLAIEGLLGQNPRRPTMQAWLQTQPRPAATNSNSRAVAPCPDCDQEMQQHRIPKTRQIVIDACGMHGIWFDHREIRAIVGEQPPPRRERTAGRRHRYGRVNDRSRFASFLDDKGDWWPWEALEELLESIERLFNRLD